MLKKLSFLLLLAVVSVGCSNSSNDPFAGYPRNAKITYKVSSKDSGGTVDVSYTNDTGGDTRVDNVALPFSISVDKKVEFAEIVELSASSRNVNSLTLEVLINGKVQETKRFDEQGRVFGYATYQFGQ